MTLPPIDTNQGTPTLSVSTRKVEGKLFESILQGAGGPKPKQSAEEELAAYVKMTPAQRMRADILKKLGLTEEDLAAMSPEERKGLEAKIADLFKQEQQKLADGPKKGRTVDISV